MKLKTLLLFVATFIFASFLLTLLVAVLIQHWKESLVKDAVELSRQHGKRIAADLSSMMEEEYIEKVEELEAHPEVSTKIEVLLKRNADIIMAALVNEEGNMIVRHYRDEFTSGTSILEPGESMESESATGANAEFDLVVTNRSSPDREFDLPITRGKQIMGFLRFSVSEEEILNRIAYSGGLITRSLMILLITLFIILALTYLFLWRIFSHHVKVVKEKDRLDKLAAIGTLASGLAHEIRNPLNAMNVNIDVIREEVEDPREDSSEKAAELLSNLQGQIHQLNSTLSNFMKFAIPGKLEKQPADLVTIVRETLEFFDAEFKIQKIRTEFDLPESCHISADVTSLKQLLMNLILNSIQAMENTERRILSIKLNQDHHECRLMLKDTGPGFEDKDTEKYFEAFFTTKHNGSGFGLPIARQIARAHDGSLEAENAEGEYGAKFILTLKKGS